MEPAPTLGTRPSCSVCVGSRAVRSRTPPFRAWARTLESTASGGLLQGLGSPECVALVGGAGEGHEPQPLDEGHVVRRGGWGSGRHVTLVESRWGWRAVPGKAVACTRVCTAHSPCVAGSPITVQALRAWAPLPPRALPLLRIAPLSPSPHHTRLGLACFLCPPRP